MTPAPVAASIAFYVFAAVILAAGIGVITAKNSISSALFLALSLLSVAGLYVGLHAEFLFATQVLVYTGGIMVLFLFVIMLVNVDELATLRTFTRRAWAPIGLASFSFLVLAAVAAGARLENEVKAPAQAASFGSNTKAVADLLFHGYLLPFEIVSVLLLVAMVGAIVLARKEA